MTSDDLRSIQSVASFALISDHAPINSTLPPCIWKGPKARTNSEPWKTSRIAVCGFRVGLIRSKRSAVTRRVASERPVGSSCPAQGSCEWTRHSCCELCASLTGAHVLRGTVAGGWRISCGTMEARLDAHSTICCATNTTVDLYRVRPKGSRCKRPTSEFGLARSRDTIASSSCTLVFLPSA